MRYALRYALVLAAVLLSACSGLKTSMAPLPAEPAQPVAANAEANDGVNEGAIERVPFKIGVSSATVEALAKEQACLGVQGAGLMTAPGPVEVYRMQCDNGKVFMARCELRQCKRM